MDKPDPVFEHGRRTGLVQACLILENIMRKYRKAYRGNRCDGTRTQVAIDCLEAVRAAYIDAQKDGEEGGGD